MIIIVIIIIIIKEEVIIGRFTIVLDSFGKEELRMCLTFIGKIITRLSNFQKQIFLSHLMWLYCLAILYYSIIFH